MLDHVWDSLVLFLLIPGWAILTGLALLGVWHLAHRATLIILRVTTWTVTHTDPMVAEIATEEVVELSSQL